MYRIVRSTSENAEPTKRFVEILSARSTHTKIKNFFSSDREIMVARAPGRLDVMGGIADYSGSLVLQLPCEEATFAALQKADNPVFELLSISDGNDEQDLSFEINIASLFKDGKPIEYAASRKLFDKKNKWAAYVIGAFIVLMHERMVAFTECAKILLYSDVPQGKGVSSSAALEVSVMFAICNAYGLNLANRDVALLCQKVENLVVGAPCGVMDQMTSVFGKQNELMTLLCQPAELQSGLQIPDEISFFGIDSGIRHQVSGSDYTSVRAGAFMGLKIIEHLIRNTHQETLLKETLERGYLSNFTPDQFEKYFRNFLPIDMLGSEFLDKYGNSSDEITFIDPSRTYKVLQPTAHPIYEHARVRKFSELLQQPASEENLTRLGALMYASHESYSACRLGSRGTDMIVTLAKELGSENGIFGAKITGGGSGGTVVVLALSNSRLTIEGITRSYMKETGHAPHIFYRSSFGAGHFSTSSIIKIS